MLYWHNYHFRNLELSFKEDSIFTSNTARYFLETLHQREVPQLWVDSMNSSLILYAEHEFNASTFTSRVMASTMSDLYSSVVGGISALKGPLHGGANEAAMDLLDSFASVESVLVEMQKSSIIKKKLWALGIECI